MSDVDQRPSRIPWPPILFALLLLIGGLLTWAAPVRFLPDARLWPAAGLLLGAIGVATSAAALVEFRRARTTFRVDLPATALVETGVFGYTRNPIYLAIATVLLGLAIGLNSLWFLLAVAVFIVAVQKLAIEPEEEHLERRFGSVYRSYKARVPRWLGLGRRRLGA